MQNFPRYDLRADSFGEAEYRFVAEGRGNVAGACVLGSGKILLVRHHIGEVDLQLIELETDTIRTVQVGFSCPPMAGRGIFRPMPPKLGVHKLTNERVLIHNPREHGVSLIDLESGKVRHYVVPFPAGGVVPNAGAAGAAGAAGVARSSDAPSAYSRVVVSGSLNEELFAVYCAGGHVLQFVHVDDGTSVFARGHGDRLFTLHLPFPIHGVHAVSRELWILQTGLHGAEYHALQFGPRVTRTRLCPIGRSPSMEEGIIGLPVGWMSTTANRIEGRAAPSGMRDRLFRNAHAPGTYTQLIPGLGAALGAMRGGVVPIFAYLRNGDEDQRTSGGEKSGGGERRRLPSHNPPPKPSTVLDLKRSQQTVACYETDGGDAKIEIVSVREGVVQRVNIAIDAPLPQGAGVSSNPNDDPLGKNMGFSKFKDDRWKSLTSHASKQTHLCELSDGRLLFGDFKGNMYVLEVRTEEIMSALEEWAAMVGGGGRDGESGDLEVGMSMNGEEIGVGSGNGEGEGESEGEGDGDGDGSGKGKGKGKGDGDGEGEGEGEGSGRGGKSGGSNTGNRKGNPDANGDLPSPLSEFEEMQDLIAKNLKAEVQRKSGSGKDNMTPEVIAQVKAAKAEAWKRLLAKIDMDEADLLKYEAYRRRVVTEIRQLRVVLESLEARKNERTWLRNKDAGDLDDRKLIDGLTGSRNIYKARGETPPDMGSFQELPKRIHFLFDLSMSMSR